MPLSTNGSDLLKFKKDISLFIETGTADGDGVYSALNAGFKEVHSIELSESLFNSCVNRFSQNDNVKLYNGSSEHLLPLILEKVNQPFVLWLDAHCSGGPYIGELMDVYLPKELNSIKEYSHLFDNSIIMIDDINYYFSNKKFISDIENLVNLLKPNGKIEYYHPNSVHAESLILVSK